MDTKAILYDDLYKLPISQEFACMASANGFRQLRELLNINREMLFAIPYFNYRMLVELRDICQSHGLNKMIE